MKAQELLPLILKGDSTALARGITLLESDRPEDVAEASVLLQSLPSPAKPQTFRIGVSGPPGVGKSTFLEALGMRLVEQGHRVAVLAIDPSSGRTGGSILGDKTRMENLSRQANAFIRPSPSRGHLGGVTSSMPGVILLCEAAGFDWILVESVGVGQSEVELYQMVDLFVLLSQPGAGDELQGIKKGILEYVDLVLVNKADRDQALVQQAKQHHLSALKILSSQAPVLACSGLKSQGIDQALAVMQEQVPKNWSQRRELFTQAWFESLLQSQFLRWLHQSPQSQKLLVDFRAQVRKHDIHPVVAASEFFKRIGLR